jgi:hypothetical protein
MTIDVGRFEIINNLRDVNMCEIFQNDIDVNVNVC